MSNAEKEKDYYSVFGVHPSATVEDIKRRYRELVLRSHPDKMKSGEDSQEFQLIQEAWEVLKDPAKKSVYDARDVLVKNNQTQAVAAEIDIADMKLENGVYSYPCSRCGSHYQITETELEDGAQVAPCIGCSYAIVVLYDCVVDEEL